jgi:hypothetical protein
MDSVPWVARVVLPGSAERRANGGGDVTLPPNERCG